MAEVVVATKVEEVMSIRGAMIIEVATTIEEAMTTEVAMTIESTTTTEEEMVGISIMRSTVSPRDK
jgi:hypothetical protein